MLLDEIERENMKILKNKLFRTILILNVLLYIGVFFVSNQEKNGTVNQFMTAFNNQEIDSISITEETSKLSIVKYQVEDTKYTVTMALSDDLLYDITNSNIEMKGHLGISPFETFVMCSITGLLIGYVLNIWLKHKTTKEMSQSMANTMMSNGMNVAQMSSKEKSVAKTVKSSTKLIDVAGCEEEKLEVTEIIDFLKNPKKYSDIGATIPKGILLVGPPGTGKTLMAKAIAGEAGVNFLSVSGSDFIEKFVGVGAGRVRSIMDEAKKKSPCIVFIDEVDAIGKQRDSGSNGGNDERDQTLNQLLVEMDGMSENNGVVIIAATNRPEILDKAFLRKGRFDRKIAINLPDTKGREEILRVHAKKKRLSESVDLRDIAKKTHGFSGADLYSALNEAAILAVREKRKEIISKDIEEGIDRVMMGHSKKGKKYTDLEKSMVAYHETGHVILGLKLSEANKIDKVTIIPRGDAGGYAVLSPKEERFLQTKDELIEKICGLLGGRAAEELIFNKITTGAHNDLEKATAIARAMVTEYGMSELGLVQYEQYGRNYAGYTQSNPNYSETVAYNIDKAIASIIEDCYNKAKKILEDNKILLDELAHILQEEETLTAERIYAINDKMIMIDEKD